MGVLTDTVNPEVAFLKYPVLLGILATAAAFFGPMFPGSSKTNHVSRFLCRAGLCGWHFLFSDESCLTAGTDAHRNRYHIKEGTGTMFVA